MTLAKTTVSKRGSKGMKPRTVYVHMGIWHDPKTGFIHITAPKEARLHSVISNKADSKRYQPKFFAQLKRILEKNDRWFE